MLNGCRTRLASPSQRLYALLTRPHPRKYQSSNPTIFYVERRRSGSAANITFELKFYYPRILKFIDHAGDKNQFHDRNSGHLFETEKICENVFDILKVDVWCE